MRKTDKGAALISALFIMTLVAIAATAMSMRLQYDIYRISLNTNSDKLLLASEAITFWAMAELKKPVIVFNKADADGKVADFPKKWQGIYPLVNLQGGIYDLQSRYNLNNSDDKRFTTVLDTILTNTLPDTQENERKNILLAVKRWISIYQPGRGNDALVTYYYKQNPPYQQSQQLMNSVSELRLIENVDAKSFLKLSPLLSVLPETTAINFNTASPVILRALSKKMNDGQFSELINARGEQGLQDLGKIMDILQKLNISKDVLTLESSYFLAIALVQGSDLTLVKYSVFKRSKDKKKVIHVSLIAQTLNTL